MTIRNDLNHLNSKKLLVRSRGGAIACKSSAIELPLDEKKSKNRYIKSLLGKAASELIQEGDTIILDSGTTTHETAKCLRNHNNVVVMTNGLNVATELALIPGIQLMMTGGRFRPKSMSFYGEQAEATLKQFRFDKLILGVDGYDIHAGITTHFDHEARLNRLMCKVSREIIVVADSSKFDIRGFQVILPFDQIGTLITDKGIPEKYHHKLAESGVNIIIVD